MYTPPHVPSSVQAFFAGSGGFNILASPLFLKKHTGKTRVFLPDHDIYHAGKDIDGNAVYTVYRVLAKEYTHNTIQGMLRVSLISGYGVKGGGGDEKGRSLFMRPNDLKKLMTEGTTSIKRNSVVVFETGMVIRLEDIEIFCDLPIIDKTELIEQQSVGAVCKRDSYKATRGEDNWAHVKQGALIKVMEASVHQLLLPYYRRYRDHTDPQHFFRAFLQDMVRTCCAHHTNFTESCDFDDLLEEISDKNRKRSFPYLQTETRPRKKWGAKSEVCVSQARVPASESAAADLVSSDAGPSKRVAVAVSVAVAAPKRDIVKEALRHVSKAKLGSIVF